MTASGLGMVSGLWERQGGGVRSAGRHGSSVRTFICVFLPFNVKGSCRQGRLELILPAVSSLLPMGVGVQLCAPVVSSMGITWLVGHPLSLPGMMAVTLACLLTGSSSIGALLLLDSSYHSVCITSVISPDSAALLWFSLPPLPPPSLPLPLLLLLPRSSQRELPASCWFPPQNSTGDNRTVLDWAGTGHWACAFPYGWLERISLRHHCRPPGAALSDTRHRCFDLPPSCQSLD